MIDFIDISLLLHILLALTLMVIFMLTLTVGFCFITLACAFISKHHLIAELTCYLERADKRPNLTNMLAAILLVPGPQSLFLVRINDILRDYHFPSFVLYMVRKLNKRLNQTEISPYAFIGPGLQIFHGHGITISSGVTIGSNCWLFQGVTIGSPRDGYSPRIGNNAFIFTNAVIAGNIEIGENVVIGANTVVIQDVPDNHMVRNQPVSITPHNFTTAESEKIINSTA